MHNTKRKTALSILLVLAMLLSLMTGFASAAAPTTIRVTVKDEAGTPVYMCQVYFKTAAGKLKSSGMTNKNGVIAFMCDPSTVYSVTAGTKTVSVTSGTNRTTKDVTVTTRWTASTVSKKAWAAGKLAGQTTVAMRSKASASSSLVVSIPNGTQLTIQEEDNYSSGWIKVSATVNNKSYTGYVNKSYIFINLADLEPFSIVPKVTNASSSLYKSSGYSISNVTGKILYNWSDKYVALTYDTAMKVAKASHKAMKDGYQIVVYDAYRPSGVSTTIRNALNTLYNSNSTVKKNIDTDANGAAWGKSWFLAQGVSYHNVGAAVDVTLRTYMGSELKMQSDMHELSTKACTKYNNANAKKLANYFTPTGLSILKSEWWHFQNTSQSRANNLACDFTLK